MTSGVVKRAMANEFVGRKLKKRDMRSLWVTRVGIAAKNHGSSYSALMNGLKILDIQINRKILADLAVHEKEVFSHLVTLAVEARKK